MERTGSQKMKEIRQSTFTEERALFGSSEMILYDSIFEKGESPLKECSNIEMYSCLMRWKYPLWYCKNIRTENCTWLEGARAGVWYSENVSVRDALIQAPKNFRRCKGLALENVRFTNALETMWHCSKVSMKKVSAAKGDYFAMNCSDMVIDGLTLDGNYSFDGAKNIEIRNSKLLTKDAFWNSENITVYDSFIAGEYLGWNSKNLTLINCTVESLQGMCYIENLVMKNCKLLGTNLAFEYSTVDAEITSRIDSVFNPAGGRICAPEIGVLTMQEKRIDPSKTEIDCESVLRKTNEPEW